MTTSSTPRSLQSPHTAKRSSLPQTAHGGIISHSWSLSPGKSPYGSGAQLSSSRSTPRTFTGPPWTTPSGVVSDGSPPACNYSTAKKPVRAWYTRRTFNFHWWEPKSWTLLSWTQHPDLARWHSGGSMLMRLEKQKSFTTWWELPTSCTLNPFPMDFNSVAFAGASGLFQPRRLYKGQLLPLTHTGSSYWDPSACVVQHHGTFYVVHILVFGNLLCTSNGSVIIQCHRWAQTCSPDSHFWSYLNAGEVWAIGAALALVEEATAP